MAEIYDALVVPPPSIVGTDDFDVGGILKGDFSRAAEFAATANNKYIINAIFEIAQKAGIIDYMDLVGGAFEDDEDVYEDEEQMN